MDKIITSFMKLSLNLRGKVFRDKRWSDILERLVNNLRTQQEAKAEELLYLESLLNALQINMGTVDSATNEAAPPETGSSDSGG